MKNYTAMKMNKLLLHETNMDESYKLNTEQTDTKGYTLYDFIYMKF